MLDIETLKMLEEIGLIDEEEYIKHTGVSVKDGAPIGSGRWPLGSGSHPYQHDPTFLYEVRRLRKEGFEYYDKETDTVYIKDTAIAKYMGLSTKQFRAKYAYLKDSEHQQDVEQAMSLRDQGLTTTEIGKIMGKRESTIRGYFKNESYQNSLCAKNIAETIKKNIDEKGMIFVGKGAETELGVSKEKLAEALMILQDQGYPVLKGGIQQAGNHDQRTTLKVIAPPGTPKKAVYEYDKINFLNDEVSYDGGLTFKKSFIYPESLDSKRLQIRYAEEGGKDKDGVIELRPGVKDISLGDAAYAQVRIMVDGTHYLKGMAVYNDNLPEGIDVLFNTNKHLGTKTKDVLKEIKPDPDNPFGSLIKEHGGQSFYDDPNGKFTDETTGKKQSLSLINKRADAGDWDEWSNHLPSQFLSKQSQKLADRQLKMAIDDKKAEYEEIMSCTNPEVKRALLTSFAQDCDAAAVKLHAASLPRQRYHVILPVNSLKDDEIFAPNYKDGETVAVIRFPHASTSELPILKVNNSNSEGRKVIGPQAPDAVGITASVAERLSGADFDGDTVMIIPCNSKVKITNSPRLRSLEGFEPKDEYATTKVTDKDGNVTYVNKSGKVITPISKSHTQKVMGEVSNLITDMTLFGADPETEISKAIKHSMVVIDAEKHKLDWKQSEKDNDIKALKEKWQQVRDPETGEVISSGAASLISRAKSRLDVPRTEGSPKINKDTGELEYKIAKDEKLYYVNKKGETVMRTKESTKMGEAKDARELISKYNTPMEQIYAQFANENKALANKARKESLNVEKFAYSPEAAKVYKKEVDSLKKKIETYDLNKPKEKKAQILAYVETEQKIKDYDLDRKKDKKDIAKIEQKAITNARAKTGAKRVLINPTDKEWEAIQAKAVSATMLRTIINGSDTDHIKKLAIPRTNVRMTDQMTKKAQRLREAVNLDGSPRYTMSQIAEALGVSPSTVKNALKLE